MATRINSSPPPTTQVPRSTPASGDTPAAAARARATDRTAPATPAATDQMTTQGPAQDPQVVNNLAQQQETNGTTALAKPPAKGLSNEPTAPVSQVDFNNMTEDQKYDYLQKMAMERGGGTAAWKTGDKELNLVGIRSFSGGQANAGEADKYNDTIYACRMNNGKKEVYAFDATVDAGKWDNPEAAGMAVRDRQGHVQGVAHMADGHYRDAFTRGEVSGSELGLRQSGWVRAHVDSNLDGKIDQNEKLGWGDKGRLAGAELQFQFHPAWGTNVGQNSAGCQGIRGEQYGKFQDLLREAPESQKTFNYTLADSGSLKSAEEQAKYQPPAGFAAIAATDPINWWNSINASGNANFFGNMNIGSQGRGLVNSDAQSITDAIKDTNDGTVDAVSNDKEGDQGIGIIRTPSPIAAWFGSMVWGRDW